MLRNFLREAIPYSIRKRVHYIFGLHGFSNEKRIASIEKTIKKKEKVNVLFIASTVSMWKAQRVFDLLNDDSDFNAQIIISPLSRYNSDEALIHVNALKKFFLERNMCIPSTTDDDFDLDKWLVGFSPDVIFFAQHYEGLHRNKLDIECNRDKLHCFIPYGLPTMKDQFVYNLSTQNLAWRIYHATKLHKKTAGRIMANNAYNVRIVGEADADAILASEHHDPWKKIADGKKRKRIIWAPHFSINHSGYLNRATFLWLSDKMVELAQKYIDEVQFVFKPHPHLHSVLCELEGWGKERTDEYYNLWATMYNTQIEEGAFYDLFWYSDAMIHDCGSFTGEYMYVRKPVMFMTTDIDYIRKDADDFGARCIDLHYIGENPSDAELFIKNIVLTGNDEMKLQREEFFNEYLLPPNGLTVAENIYNDLKKSLRE